MTVISMLPLVLYAAAAAAYIAHFAKHEPRSGRAARLAAMASDLTRRDLIRVGGAGAAGIALLGTGACDGSEPAPKAVRAKAPPNAMNVVVVVMDTLRVDHVYGSRARTPALNSLAQEGLRFLRAYPEGLPTIPARRAAPIDLSKELRCLRTRS